MTDEATTTPGNGRRVQARKVRAGGFSVAKRQVVLDHLAARCNAPLETNIILPPPQ